jgi:hypothetical protein
MKAHAKDDTAKTHVEEFNIRFCTSRREHDDGGEDDRLRTPNDDIWTHEKTDDDDAADSLRMIRLL